MTHKEIKSISNNFPLKLGFLQGSVLGLLLQTEDLPTNSEIVMGVFATSAILQRDLIDIKIWSLKWRLTFTLRKN